MPRLAAAVAAALLTLAATAHADLATGREKLATGDYKTALGELAKVSGKDRGEARLLLAAAQRLTGDYANAEQTAIGVAKDRDPKLASRGHIEAARIMLLTGRYADARKELEPIVAKNPDDRGARHELALVDEAVGDRAAADKLWQLFMDEWDAKKVDMDDPDQLYWLAEAARYTGQFDFANDSYRESVAKGDPAGDAALAWADLFLSKYSSGYADQTLEEIFKVNPNHPDAHAAAAAVELEDTYDLAAANSHLDKALAINPKSERAMLVRASVQIDQNQWDAAKKTLGDVLAINPSSCEALSMLATIAWLRDDKTEYEAQRKKVLAINPQYSKLYELIGRSAVREHRYVEAIEIEKQAVALVADDFNAMSEIGMGYLRLGDEKQGKDWLDKSWDGDKYNVRTYNTLNLFDRLPKEYAFHDSPHFRFRFHKDESAILERYIEPMLEQEYKELSARYGFQPKTPIIVELYADKDDYSIRTVGLPDLGALGVCFGQVITAMSPANGDINWGMVLWHEMAHVFAIQLSNSRVPRWFTEGLSEYETLIHDPSWRRENDSDVYGAVSQGTLPSVATLNYEFMQPDPQGVVVAYFLSAVNIEYIAQTYGFPKIVEALKLFAKGKETPEVIQTITGRTVAQYDADFRKYLDARLAAWKGTFRLPTKGFDDPTKLEIALAAAPKDPDKAAAVALGWYYAGEAEKAATAAQAALDLDGKNPIARYVLAEVLVHAGDTTKAKALYEGLAADGHDSFDIRIRLAQLAQGENDMKTVEAQLCAAKGLDPESSYPYQELAALYKKQGKDAASLVEMEHYVFLEQMQLAPLKELIEGYTKLNRWDKVRTYGEMAVFIAPSDTDVLLALGNAYLQVSQADKALFTFDSAIAANPPLRRPALAHIGRAKAYVALGQKPKAKAAVAQALKTEPENADALALKKQVP
ncbi:MAG TPA: tetratricopeptide repeat protein [Kofleriaceae bacterium]|nr:tetratricopeptide repeat protein [Kofleriaceae bacterium]